MTDTVRSFTQTQQLARQLGNALTLIEKNMPYRTMGKARKLVAIADAMDLIMDTPNTSLGFGETLATPNYAGFPNGRRPHDDVIDVLLFFIANQQAITDNANVNEVPALNTFPFFPPPHQPRPAGTGAEDLTRN